MTNKTLPYYSIYCQVPENFTGVCHFEIEEISGYPILETRYYVNGNLHRANGPAVESQFYEHWYCRGNLHRLDGPANLWFGKLHKGFAPVYAIMGERYTEQTYWNEFEVIEYKIQKIINFSGLL